MLGASTMAASLLIAPIGEVRFGLVLGTASISAIAVLYTGFRRWLPERACQVASVQVLRWGRKRAALQWGLKLGTGVSTFMVTPALYALLGVAASQRAAVVAGLLCAAYGMARGMTIACFALTEGHRDAEAARGIQKSVGALERVLRVPLVIAIVLAALAAIG